MSTILFTRGVVGVRGLGKKNASDPFCVCVQLPNLSHKTNTQLFSFPIGKKIDPALGGKSQRDSLSHSFQGRSISFFPRQRQKKAIYSEPGRFRSASVHAYRSILYAPLTYMTPLTKPRHIIREKKTQWGSVSVCSVCVW